ncbi:MAG: hypothetical protein IJS96_03390 [Schwartzia sp.]|nr:hypothetical protein [Schwartzia sp. (in: firmicutes)]
MASKYVDKAGLTYFKQKQDAANDAVFVKKVEGKGLSTNDYDNDASTKLSGIAAGAQVNVVESVEVDGTTQTIDGKKVTLDLSAYAKKADVGSAFIYKGSVTAFASLPVAGLATGYVYNIANAGGTDTHGTPIKAGDNVAYNGSGWDVLAGSEDLSGYALKTDTEALSNAEIDTLFVSGSSSGSGE